MILAVMSTDLRVRGSGDLFEAADNVAEALIDLEESHPALEDSTVSVDGNLNQVTIDLSVRAETLEEAAKIGDACLRAAIHTTGGFTPGWNDGMEPTIVRKNAELVDA